MLLCNYFPLLHLAGIAWWASRLGGWHGTLTFIAGLYLLPPLLCRIVLWQRPLRGGTYALDSPEFLTWWMTAQLQMVFCRLPFLEELLRLVPALYSAWLRLWGSKIGSLVFWSPGLRILDRSFLQIGDGVVTGAGVRLNAHVIDITDGKRILHVATIHIGAGANVGGYSLASAGSTVAAGETLHAFALLPPFSRWEGGKRTRLAHPENRSL